MSDDTDRASTVAPTDDVAVLRWPADAELRAALILDQVPRVLVLDDDAPPTTWDDDEDWVRADADPVELAARIDRLRASTTDRPRAPLVDTAGVVRVTDGRWTTVSRIEARLLTRLTHQIERPVSRDALHRAAWPSGGVSLRAVDGRIRTLRRRIAPLDLSVHTVRGIGYLLSSTGS